MRWIIYTAAIAIAVFELGFQMGFFYYLYTLGVPYLPATLDVQQVQAAVMALTLVIIFLTKPLRGRPLYGGVLAALGFTSFIYIFVVFQELIYRVGLPTPLDLAMGILAIALMLEATRRAAGPVLPLVALAFLTYGLWYGVATYSHTENPLARAVAVLINHLYLAKEGIFGTPLFVMVTYVYAFVLFGAFLEKLGIGSYITNFVLSLLGRKPGGPAKVAVVSSALMGTVSGSSVANVLTTGTFTIPMMKKAKMPPEMAGGVEASASTGGQLMPPIMGAAAFVMAEFLGRPYRDVMISGFLPAALYFFSMYLFIDFFVKKLGIKPLPQEELPVARRLARQLYLFAPIPLIAYLLIVGIPPQHSAIAALTVAIVASIAAKPLSRGTKAVITTTVAAIGLALAATGVNIYTVILLLGVLTIIAVAAVGLLYRKARDLARLAFDAVVSAGVTVSTVFLAASVAGVIQGVLTYTGLVTSIGDMLIRWTGGNPLALLFVTMAISLVLGMGVPTTANYIITSLVSASAVAYAISNLGYDYASALLAAHFFVFYFGILADVTPPVALAAYAASTLAGSHFFRTALYATRFALAGYLVPYMFALHPPMLAATVTQWTADTILSIALNTTSAIVGIYLLAGGVVGHLGGPLPTWIRTALVATAVLTIITNPYETPAILAIATTALIATHLKYRTQKTTTPQPPTNTIKQS
ncbi:MAG: TRAP transporter permease [Pyrobaculum sp.]